MEHHWSHDLVLCPELPQNIPQLTVEERLSQIEEKFDKQLETRLARVETLLMQLVEGKIHYN